MKRKSPPEVLIIKPDGTILRVPFGPESAKYMHCECECVDDPDGCKFEGYARCANTLVNLFTICPVCKPTFDGHNSFAEYVLGREVKGCLMIHGRGKNNKPHVPPRVERAVEKKLEFLLAMMENTQLF